MCRVVIDNEACEDATVVKVLSFPICVRCPTLSMYGGSSLVNGLADTQHLSHR